MFDEEQSESRPEGELGEEQKLEHIMMKLRTFRI